MDPSYNSFGSFDLNGGQPITSGAVMPVADDTKKKRRLVIGAIIVGVLVVVAIMVFFVINKNYSAEQKYLNYIVNGNENNNKNVGEEYSPLRAYYFNEIISSKDTEEFEGFYNKAKALLGKINNANKSAIVSSIDNYLEIFKVQYEVMEYSDGEAIAELYLAGGEDAINEKILSKVRSINFEKDAYAEEYVDNMNTWVDDIMSIVKLYRSAGCTGETVEALNKCELSGKDQVSMSVLNDSAMRAEDNVIDTIKDMYERFVADAYELITTGGDSENK